MNEAGSLQGTERQPRISIYEGGVDLGREREEVLPETGAVQQGLPTGNGSQREGRQLH